MIGSGLIVLLFLASLSSIASYTPQRAFRNCATRLQNLRAVNKDLFSGNIANCFYITHILIPYIYFL